MNLVLESPTLSLDEVRANRRLIKERGFDREQDLEAKPRPCSERPEASDAV